MKSLLTLAFAGALAASASAAWAHDSSLADSIDAPHAAEARVGFRVPLGGDRFVKEKSTYGASIGFANSGPVSQRSSHTIAEFNLSGGGHVEQARVGGFNFAGGQTSADGTRLGFDDVPVWVTIAGVLVLVWGVYELTQDDDPEPAPV